MPKIKFNLLSIVLLIWDISSFLEKKNIATLFLEMIPIKFNYNYNLQDLDASHTFLIYMF